MVGSLSHAQPQVSAAWSASQDVGRIAHVDRHEARQDTRWGFMSHRIQMMVCQRCSYILHFYRHQSIFNFD